MSKCCLSVPLLDSTFISPLPTISSFWSIVIFTFLKIVLFILFIWLCSFYGSLTGDKAFRLASYQGQSGSCGAWHQHSPSEAHWQLRPHFSPTRCLVQGRPIVWPSIFTPGKCGQVRESGQQAEFNLVCAIIIKRIRIASNSEIFFFCLILWFHIEFF